MTLLIIAFFLFSLFILLSLLLFVYERNHGSKRKIDRRLVSYAVELGLSNEQLPLVLRDEKLSDISLFNRFLSRLNFPRKLRLLLEQTDISLKVGTVVLLIAVLGAAGFFLTVRSENILLRVLMPFGLASMPVFYILFRRNRRLRTFIREFPDALDMMTSSLRAGHALNKALQMVAIEAPDPIGVEFRKTFEENSLGLPLRDALVNLTQRINSLDLKLFITAVLLQRETGGDLSEILEKISYTIRERFKLMGQIRIYTAQGRMSMWVLGSLPLVMMAIIQSINPDYFAPMLEDRTGRMFLMIGFGLEVIGILVIRRITRIRFQ